MARAFIELWHYAGALPTGKNITFGWFVTGELYAVACYGNGGNMDGGKFLAKLTGFPVTRTNLVELRRLCRSEPPRPDYPLSQFIAACHRLLKRDHGKRFVVSYSDPAHGHNGGIYKASNFRHLGRTGDGYHTADRKGQIVHRRRAYRLAKREGISTAAARKRLGLKVQRTMGRDRWLLDIGPTTGRQAPTVAVQRAGRRGSVPARLTPPRESW